MKTIDPTEILTGKESISTKGFEPPWIRLFARLFDYALLCMIIWATGFSFADSYEHWIPWELLAWLPIEAALLSTWGTTPGKWLLKVKITPHLRFEQALKRSLSVWMRGIGMGIPFVNFFCLLIAYKKLRLLKTTSWDRDAYTKVTCGHLGRFRFCTVATFAIMGLLFYTSQR